MVWPCCVLLNFLIRLQDVTCLIIDEVHERDLETEMLLLLVHHLVRENPDIKVILMSATIEESTYKNYFNMDNVKTSSVKERIRK